MTEPEHILARYARRRDEDIAARYDFLNVPEYMMAQERERALIRWIHRCRITPIAEKRVLEVGCGTGKMLQQFIRLGFDPANLSGNDLLPDSLAVARHRLPASVSLHSGNALQLDLPPASFDIVLQSTVFSSILDQSFQQRLSDMMWRPVKPGGGILWYDFTYNNPRNPDVAGVSVARVKRLFPDGQLSRWRLTLAPPVSRIVTRVTPRLYTVVNLCPFLRTHVLCWIAKRCT